MKNDQPIKLDIRAAKLLFAQNPKEDAIRYLAGLINEQAGDDATFEDFQRAVSTIKKTDAGHFVSDNDRHEAGAGKTASDRLEDWNRKTELKFRAENPAPGRLDFTEKERKQMESMNAEQRLDVYNAKIAAVRNGKK